MLSESILNQAMNRACAEARQWLGATSPNPPVGAVALDGNGNVLAVMAHHKAGELHAEAALIQLCREQNILEQIHTLCVTLEPCNHHGRTPPCTEAIIRSGIKHVVVGTRDPNPDVKGGGIDALRKAGIQVIYYIQEQECRQLIHAFAYRVTTGKPWVTVKRAFDKNGSMIPPPGQKVFTSEQSLKLAHQLRKKADAILTGSGTILADTPLFSVRHVGDFDSKRRILGILDRRGRVAESYLKAAHERGLIPMVFQNLDSAFESLTREGAQDVLIEAGPLLSQAVLDAGLWTMKVDIHKGEPDQVEVGFNSAAAIPFSVDKFDWKYMLPE